MKTIKTIFSIALIALTSSLFARLSEPEAGCNCCPADVVTDVVIEMDLHMENWMSIPFEGNALETEMAVENWMLSPFEASLETDLALENWMLVPFESSLDKELALEHWMLVPFESSIENEELQLESWMAATWI